jgi:hypothetical protein
VLEKILGLIWVEKENRERNVLDKKTGKREDGNELTFVLFFVNVSVINE